MPSAKTDNVQATSNVHLVNTLRQPHVSAAVPQLDGPYHQLHNTVVGRTRGPGQQHSARQQHHIFAQPPPRQRARAAQSAASDLLPYCTMTPPLDEAQVIALSDVAGSLRELVLLALGAAVGHAACVRLLEGAVGEQAAGGIAEFFIDEWEMDG